MSAGRSRFGGTWTKRRSRSAAIAASVAGAASLASPVAWAQLSRTDASVQATVTATNNDEGATGGDRQSDVFVSVRPSVQWRREGSGLRMSGQAAADFVDSTRGTRRDRILPSGRVDAGATLVDRLLFLDASADLRQVEIDPFGVRVDSGSALNARTIGTLRLSPRLEVPLSSSSSLAARHDAAWTHVRGTLEGDLTTQRSAVTLRSEPRPIGTGLEWSREESTYRANAQSDLSIEQAIASLDRAVGGDWVIGVRAGRERSTIGGVASTDNLLGLRAFWAPGPRTELAATADRRFFGTGWDLGLRHRTPRMSFVVKLAREPVSASSGIRPGGLETFLDAILTTRNPDASQRGDLVGELMASRGLPSASAGGSAAAADYAQLRTSGSVDWVYLGARSTLSLSLQGEQRVRLASDGLQPAVPGGGADLRRRGASAGWNHRLTRQASLDVNASASQVDGLAARTGERTREASLRPSLVVNLAPRTNLSIGAAWRKLVSNAVGVASFDETSGYVGLTHRF